MSTTEKRIGAKITEARLFRNLTQFQLAERVGVSVETVSRLERGIIIPSLKTIDNIAKTLDAPLKSFFDFEDEPGKSQPFERELSKLVVFLRKLTYRELSLVHQVLKAVLSKVKIRKK